MPACKGMTTALSDEYEKVTVLCGQKEIELHQERMVNILKDLENTE